jgi:hypothetical protein
LIFWIEGTEAEQFKAGVKPLERLGNSLLLAALAFVVADPMSQHSWGLPRYVAHIFAMMD